MQPGILRVRKFLNRAGSCALRDDHLLFQPLFLPPSSFAYPSPILRPSYAHPSLFLRPSFALSISWLYPGYSLPSFIPGPNFALISGQSGLSLLGCLGWHPAKLWPRLSLLSWIWAETQEAPALQSCYFGRCSSPCSLLFPSLSEPLLSPLLSSFWLLWPPLRSPL